MEYFFRSWNRKKSNTRCLFLRLKPGEETYFQRIERSGQYHRLQRLKYIAKTYKSQIFLSVLEWRQQMWPPVIDNFDRLIQLLIVFVRTKKHATTTDRTRLPSRIRHIRSPAPPSIPLRNNTSPRLYKLDYPIAYDTSDHRHLFPFFSASLSVSRL